MLKHHYGVWIDSELPITGVISNNTPEWLVEEYTFNGIDLGWEYHLAECELDDHDYCDMPEWGESDILIGSWIKNSEGLYEPDHSGEYAAIVGEIYTQIVWSKYVTRANLCSPCYPGQCDLDSHGEYLAYMPPPEIYGDSFEIKRVFSLYDTGLGL